MSSVIEFSDATFRDGQQSLIATRLSTSEILPIAEILDKAGFYSMEVWGGATFDVCLRYLNENPWERLRSLKKALTNTPLQMLLRNRYILGYKPYPSEIVELFIKKTAKNGMDIFRIFDALNDINNMEEPILFAKETGKHVQGTIMYTISPVHDINHYIETGKKLVNLGVDSLCLDDASGLLAPQDAYSISKELLKLGVPIEIHAHCTSGMASIDYFKAMEAGIKIVDTTLSSFALGPSLPPLETMIASLEETGFKHKINTKIITAANHELKKLREKRKINSNMFIVNTEVIKHQIPGGMISNLISQLTQMNMLDRFEEVLEEVPKVRKDLGYPILATPTSQMVGSQSLMNVIYGKRYKVIIKEVKDYVRGVYGSPVGEINKDLIEKVKTQMNRYKSDKTKHKSIAEMRKEIGMFYKEEEDALSYALFPEQALKYFEYRLNKENIEDDDYLIDYCIYPV